MVSRLARWIEDVTRTAAGARRRTRRPADRPGLRPTVTAWIPPMPWPQPQMSRHALARSPPEPKFIFDGSLVGRLSGSRPALTIDGAQVVAVHAGEQVGVDDVARPLDSTIACLVALRRVGFLRRDEAPSRCRRGRRPSPARPAPSGRWRSRRTARAGRRTSARISLHQRERRQRARRGRRRRRHRDQAVGALLDRLVRVDRSLITSCSTMPP